MKTVTYSADAVRALRRHSNVAARLRKAIDAYAADGQAHANQVTQLVGSARKRLRVSDFRILFEEREATIVVVKIGPRGDVYD